MLLKTLLTLGRLQICVNASCCMLGSVLHLCRALDLARPVSPPCLPVHAAWPYFVTYSINQGSSRQVNDSDFNCISSGF